MVVRQWTAVITATLLWSLALSAQSAVCDDGDPTNDFIPILHGDLTVILPRCVAPDPVEAVAGFYVTPSQMELTVGWSSVSKESSDFSHFNLHWFFPNGREKIIKGITDNYWGGTPQGNALEPYGQYEFRVSACNTLGACSDPEDSDVLILNEPAPPAPVPVVDMLTPEIFDISWTDVTVGGIKWPNLVEYELVDVTDSFIVLYDEGTSTGPFSIDKFEQPGTYQYGISACNGSGGCNGSGFSVTVIEIPAGPPAISGSLQYEGNGLRLNALIDYDDPGGRSVDFYRASVERDGEVLLEDDYILTDGADFADVSLSGIAYGAVTVTARSCIGSPSSPTCSDPVSETISEPVPSAPTGVTITDVDGDPNNSELWELDWAAPAQPNVVRYEVTLLMSGMQLEQASVFAPDTVYTLDRTDTPGDDLSMTVAACNYSGVCGPAAVTPKSFEVEPYTPYVDYSVDPVEDISPGQPGHDPNARPYHEDFRSVVNWSTSDPRADRHIVRWEYLYDGDYVELSSDTFPASVTQFTADPAQAGWLSTYRFSVQACRFSTCSDPVVTVLEEPVFGEAVFFRDVTIPGSNEFVLQNPQFANVYEITPVIFRGTQPVGGSVQNLVTQPVRNLGQNEFRFVVTCPTEPPSSGFYYVHLYALRISNLEGRRTLMSEVITSTYDPLAYPGSSISGSHGVGMSCEYSDVPDAVDANSVSAVYADESALAFDVEWSWSSSNEPEPELFKVEWLVNEEIIDAVEVDYVDGIEDYDLGLDGHTLVPDIFGTYAINVSACNNNGCSDAESVTLDEPTPDAPAVSIANLAGDPAGYRLEWEKDFRNIIGYEVTENYPGPKGNENDEWSLTLFDSVNGGDQFEVECPSLTDGNRQYSITPLTTTNRPSSSASQNRSVSAGIGTRFSCRNQMATDSEFPVEPGPAGLPSDLLLTGTDLNEASSVGSTGGSFRVDESGNATYSIPIMTAPATGGMAPQISVNYSSGGGAGVLGVGWSIGGLSTIARCGQTKEVDGTYNSGVQLNDQDRFCLDGQRLILVSGSPYGGTNTEYRTEIDTFARVTTEGFSNASGPESFKVERKDGTTAYYGKTSDSRIDGMASGTSEPAFVWAINRIEDASGNYMLFEYEENTSAQSNGELSLEYYISQIRYAGNGQDVQPGNTIEFTYDNWGYTPGVETHGPVVGYVGGKQIKVTKRLLGITSKGTDYVLGTNGVTETERELRNYEFNPKPGGDGSGRYVLESIRECAGNVCLAPLTFQWSHFSPDQSDPTYGGVNPNTSQGGGIGSDFFPASVQGMQTIQANSDGLPDLFYTANTSAPHRRLFVRINTGNFGFAQPPFADYTELPLPVSFNAQDGGWTPMDVNGDGMTDVLFVQDMGQDAMGQDQSALFAMLANDQAGGSNPWYDNPVQVSPLLMGSSFQPTNGDYNGDGVVDVVVASSLGVRYLTGRSAPDANGHYFSDERELELSPYVIQNPEVLFGPDTFPIITPVFRSGADFNGDGIPDMLLRIRVRETCPAGGCQPHEFAGTETAIQTEQSAVAQILSGEGPSRVPGEETAFRDYFAIAYTEVDPYTGDLSVSANVVTSTIPVAEACIPGQFVCSNLFNVRALDLNADGLSDLVYQSSQSSGLGGLTFNYLLNTGRGLRGTGVLPGGSNDPGLLIPYQIGNVPHGAQARFMDWDGDGLTDLVYLEDNPSATHASPNGHRWRVQFNRTGKISMLETANNKILNARGGYPPHFVDEGQEPEATTKVALFADVSGDGITDQLLIEYALDGDEDIATLTLGVNTADDNDYDLNAITAITDGYGATTVIEYNRMVDPTFYRRGFGVSNPSAYGRGSPVYDLLSPQHLVSRVSSSAPTTDNQNGMVSVSYEYEGARAQTGGRGFLGFDKIITTDEQRNVVTETTYRQDFPFVGMPDTTERLLFGTLRIGYAKNTWSVKSLNANRTYYPYIANSYEVSYELDGSPISCVTTTSNYDNYGNLTTSSASTYSNCGSSAPSGAVFQTQSTTNTYGDDDVQKWHLGRITKTRVETSRDGPPVIRESTFDYDSVTGLLNSEVVWNLDPGAAYKSLKTDYVLDRFGNATWTKVRARNAAGAVVESRESQTVYDGSGRFVVQSLNAYGQSVQEVTRYNQFGQPMIVRDAWGTVTHTRYDRMGRAYVTYAPLLGTWSRTVHAVPTTACPTGTAYMTDTDLVSGVDTSNPSAGFMCYDKLGREVRSAEIGDGGTMIYADMRYDNLGRTKQVSDPYYAGSSSQSIHWTINDYDAFDRVIETIHAAGVRTFMRHEGLVMYTKQTDATGNTLYGPIRKTTKNPLGEITDVEDNPGSGPAGYVANTDRDGGALTSADRPSVSYEYTALGQLEKSIRPDGEETDLAYDGFGNRIFIDDPEAGIVRTAYNAYGELLCQVDATGDGIAFQYDQAGRKVREEHLTGLATGNANCLGGTLVTTSRWMYDTIPNEEPKLVSESVIHEGFDAPPDLRRDFAYDVRGRIATTTTTISGASAFVETFTYDQHSRPFWTQDISGDAVLFTYDDYGRPYTIEDADVFDDTVYEKITERTSRGQIKTMRMAGQTGSGDAAYKIVVGKTFIDKTGLPDFYTTQAGGSTLTLDMGWDADGMLRSRERTFSGSGFGDHMEAFSYDALNRLTGVAYDGAAPRQVTYDASGNIRSRPGKSYGYTSGSNKVRTVNGTSLSYDVKGNRTSTLTGGTVDYTVFNKPSFISEDSNALNTVEFAYGPNRSRYLRRTVRTVSGEAGGAPQTETAYIIGNVEYIIDSTGERYRRQIGSSTVVTKHRFTQAESTNYLQKDHLGSIVAIIDETGAFTDHMQFDPWGQRLDVNNWLTEISVSSALIRKTNRGFTGHEMLDNVGLIHMNGRVYDPQVGGFLTPDPFVQAPGNTQSHNRYIYVLNNPMALVDPSGYITVDPYVRAVISIAISIWVPGAWSAAFGTSTGVATVAAGFLAGAVNTGTLDGALIGAFSAGVFFGIGSYFDGLAAANGKSAYDSMLASTGSQTLADLAGTYGARLTTAQSVAKVAAHGIAGGVMSRLNGGKFGNGFASAGVAQAFAPTIGKFKTSAGRIVVASLIGGAASRISGSDFVSGAVTAAFSRAFNEEVHFAQDELEKAIDAQASVVRGKVSGFNRAGNSNSYRAQLVGGFIEYRSYFDGWPFNGPSYDKDILVLGKVGVRAGQGLMEDVGLTEFCQSCYPDAGTVAALVIGVPPQYSRDDVARKIPEWKGISDAIEAPVVILQSGMQPRLRIDGTTCSVVGGGEC